MHDALMGTSGVLLGILIAFLLNRWGMNPLTKGKHSATLLEPEEDDGEEDISERVAGIEKAQRMLLGRLNKLAPPRQGTGNGEEAPEVMETPLPPTRARAQVLQAWRKRQGR